MANDARIPSVTELHNRAHQRLRDAWRAPPLPEADPSGGADAGDSGVRIDVANVPKVADLYARHAARSLVRWKNGGDDVRAPVKR